MKLLTMLVSSIAISTIALTANAGPSSSGGGAALVCRQPDGKIRYVELLDLYEARAKFHMKLVASTGSIEEDYYQAAHRTYTLQGYPHLAPTLRSQILESLRGFYDLAQMTGKLPKLDDLGNISYIVPEGCAIEQLAIFHDKTPMRVQIDLEIWNALDTLNRAALASHEAHYHYERKLNERTSEATRAFVAHIYAANVLSPVSEGIPASAISCSSHDPRFNYVTDSGPDWTSSTNDRLSAFKAFPWMTPEGLGTRLQFSHIGGRAQIKKTIIEIPNVAFALSPRWSNELKQEVCVVSEADKNIRREISLRGGLRPDSSIEVIYVTGQPVKLIMKESGVAITEEYVTSCHR